MTSTQLSDDLGDDVFVGYTFTHPPERRPRLWFLDRQLEPLILGTDHAVTRDDETGIWTAEYPPDTDDLSMPSPHLRYQHFGPHPWTAVWRLTDTTIQHVHTFGHDDVWRLAIWPD